MEIQGKVQAEISVKGAKHYPSTNAKMATVRLSMRCDPAIARKVFGEPFGSLMFPPGGQRSEDGEYHHPYSHPEPKGTLGGHVVMLLDREIKLCPELAGVTAVDGQEAVDVDVDLPIEITKTNSKWFGDLVCSVGESIEVNFQPQQLSLPGTKSDDAHVIKVPGPHGKATPKVVG
jgi:hypothetical protein